MIFELKLVEMEEAPNSSKEISDTFLDFIRKTEAKYTVLIFLLTIVYEKRGRFTNILCRWKWWN